MLWLWYVMTRDVRDFWRKGGRKTRAVMVVLGLILVGGAVQYVVTYPSIAATRQREVLAAADSYISAHAQDAAAFTTAADAETGVTDFRFSVVVEGSSYACYARVPDDPNATDLPGDNVVCKGAAP